MSLALAPDNIDRYGDEYGRDYGYDHDDYHPGSHLPFMRVGTVSDTALDGNSTLAGVDEITALKWKYQDRIVVMGLVFGSTSIASQIRRRSESAPTCSAADHTPCIIQHC
jgi:hypothetical protein